MPWNTCTQILSSRHIHEPPRSSWTLVTFKHATHDTLSNTVALQLTLWCRTISNAHFISLLIKAIIAIVPSSALFTRCLCRHSRRGRRHSSASASVASTASSAGNLLHLNVHHLIDDSRDYRRLLVQLEETERRFDDFWHTHMTRLRQCLDLRRFEQDFRELQVTRIWMKLKVKTEFSAFYFRLILMATWKSCLRWRKSEKL